MKAPKIITICMTVALLSGCNVEAPVSEPPKGYDSSITLQAEVSTLITDCTQVAEMRLMSEYPQLDLNVTYPDAETSVIEFNCPENWNDTTLETLCRYGELTFRKGTDTEVNSEGQTVPTGEIILQNADINEAEAVIVWNPDGGDWQVDIKLCDSGREKFADATRELAGTDTPIAIWFDDELISAPTVSTAIIDGNLLITGNFTKDSAKELAAAIDSGALPCGLDIIEFNIGDESK